MSVERPRTHWRRTYERQARRQKPKGFGRDTVRTTLFAAVMLGLAVGLYPAMDEARFVQETPSSLTPRYFRNCDAARAAGAAPIRIGQPGYRPQLDADSDGIACEWYR